MKIKVKGISITENRIIFPLKEPQEAPETAPMMAPQEANGQESPTVTNFIPTSETQFAGAPIPPFESLPPPAPVTAPVTGLQEQVNETLPSISEGSEGSEGPAPVIRDSDQKQINELYEACPFSFHTRVNESLEDEPKTPSLKHFHSTVLGRSFVDAFQKAGPDSEGSEDSEAIPTPVEKVPGAVYSGGDPFESDGDFFSREHFVSYHRDGELGVSTGKHNYSKVERVFRCAEEGFIGATAYQFVQRDSISFVYVHLGFTILIGVAKLGFRAFFRH